MAEIVNLRLARKAKQRAEKERQAEANRARHGLSRIERKYREQEAERAKRELDGKKLRDDD
ncbi:MAG: DUF4169 family protein [Novosphingobium sp.]|nr:DUF4169 family protein [Novosphingobium sp.]